MRLRLDVVLVLVLGRTFLLGLHLTLQLGKQLPSTLCMSRPAACSRVVELEMSPEVVTATEGPGSLTEVANPHLGVRYVLPVCKSVKAFSSRRINK